MSAQWVPIHWRLADSDPHDAHAVEIQVRGQRDGTDRYIVKQLGNVLSRWGEWEWEPQPSSRDDDFIARTRFASFAEAADAWERFVAIAVPAPGADPK